MGAPTPWEGLYAGRLLAAARPYVRLTGDFRLEVDGPGLRQALPDPAPALQAAELVAGLLDRARAGKGPGRAEASRLRRLRELFALVAAGFRNPDGLPYPWAPGLCDGHLPAPHPCPVRRWSRTPLAGRGALERCLAGLGYHPTAAYAAQGRAADRDFTRPAAAYGFGAGAFRAQALAVPLRGGRWLYWEQEPEPNPEVLAYFPPFWWWPAYAAWWRRYLCS